MEFGLIALSVIVYLIVMIVIVFFVVLMEDRSTTETYAWILLMLLAPVVGVVLFLLFGRNWRKNNKDRNKKNAEIYSQTSESLKEVYEKERQNLNRLKKDLSKEGFLKIPNIGYAAPYMMLTSNQDIRIYSHGKQKFEDLLEDIKSAKKYVHMEYYIYTTDDVVGEIFDALIERAKAGVEVRIFYDSVGSLSLKKKDKDRLLDAGVKIHSGRSALNTINYRSHRKIIIIDANITYIGGMNMSEHYVTGGKYDEWRDTHLRVVGNLAASTQELFATYWFHATKEDTFGKEYLPPSDSKSFEYTGLLSKDSTENDGAKMVQLIHSGADTNWETIRQVYEEMISSAKETVILQTPYFIPSESIYSALINAALGGVKVKVILAGISNNLMSHNASHTYFKELLLAGVEIYQFQTGFIHSKCMSIDSKIATVGSANLDSRSMRINYEANVVIYDQRFTKDLEEVFEVDITKSHKLTLEELESAGFFTRLKWSLFALFSPLL